MTEAKTPKAKKPKAKPFGKGRFSFGEGMVHLADALGARGGKSSPAVMKFGERDRWRLEK